MPRSRGRGPAVLAARPREAVRVRRRAPEPTLWGIRGVGGILEAVGGPLLALGLFTRPVAFILSGEMAVAYFRSWAPRGFFPIANGGEEATLNAYIFLWLVAAGAGAWSLDALIARGKDLGALGRRVAAWEPQARAMLRLILGFLITLHGIRKVFEVLPSVAGRRGAPPLALDSLPPLTGYIELVAGPLLMLGLFVRQTALIVSLEALLAYVLIAQPRTLWPIRNGGIEALLYLRRAPLLRRRGRRGLEPRRAEDARRGCGGFTQAAGRLNSRGLRP